MRATELSIEEWSCSYFLRLSLPLPFGGICLPPSDPSWFPLRPPTITFSPSAFAATARRQPAAFLVLAGELFRGKLVYSIYSI